MGDLRGAPPPSGLELTIGVPGLSSFSGSEGGGCHNVRELDMNQPASMEEEEFPMGSVEEEEEVEEGGTHRPKKLRLSKEQSRLLEESFRQNHTLNSKQKDALAMKLKLRPRQVEVWFQNRRARTKLKQTEMECEYLKRCFGSLTEENRRLQREVEELRALRVAPPTVLSPHSRQPLPASSLSMCPRCQRVTAAPTAVRCSTKPPPSPSSNLSGRR
ncbi:homeobox-leucine zipper protein HOX3-like isoform X1 [Typha latifolia]|uniref:homeobox-leucine zipper protein HOX3-like isoform X1 n=2 Tax=Typha latifolia TaxID=4733 RepID=UPI003C2B895E